MAFCNQCGQQNADDNSYCTSCGAPLKAGSEEKSIPVVKTNIKIDDIINIVVGILTRPVTLVRAVTKLDIQTFAALAGIMALLWGLLGMWLVKRMAVTIGSIMEQLMGGLGGLMSMVSDGIMSEINSSIHFGSVFFFGLLFYLAVIFGLYLGQFATGKFMLKSAAGSTPYFNVAVSSQVPLMTAIMLGLVLSYLSMSLGLVVMKFGAIVSVICLFFGLRQVSEAENDRVVYALPLVIVVMYLVVYIFVRIYLAL